MFCLYGQPVGIIFLIQSCCCLVAKSCPTLCDPRDCSPPGSSVHGISQARILYWVAMPSSRGSSLPEDWTHLSCTGLWFFTTEPLGKPNSSLTFLILWKGSPGGATGKEPAYQCSSHKRHGLNPGLGKSPRGGRGNPLQCSCLENPMNRGAWRAIAHGGCRVGHDWSDFLAQHSTQCYETIFTENNSLPLLNTC